MKRAWVFQIQKAEVRAKPALLKYLTGPWELGYDQG